jgi:autotransporter-associated beta strand protein
MSLTKTVLNLSVLAGVVATVVCAPSAHGAPIAYDGFDYPAGSSLVGQDGGQGFAGPWYQGGANVSQSVNLLASGSLSSSSLATAGNQVTTAATSGINGVERDFASPISSGTIYLSFLLQPEGTLGQGNEGGFLGVYLHGGLNDLFVGKPGGGSTSNYVLEQRGAGGTDQAVSPGVPVVGQTEFLVLKAQLFSSGNDIFTLYADPTPGAPQPATGAVKQDFTIGSALGLVIYSGGAFNIDELRVGTAYADVTPMSAPSITWNTPGGGTWNTVASNKPWLGSGGSAAAFSNSANVTFNLGGTNPITVDAGGVQPGWMTFAATAGNYTFSGGAIAGTSGLTLSATGSVTFNNANTYSGGTNLTAGLLNINCGSPAVTTSSAVGTGSLTISGGSLGNSSGGNVTLGTNNVQVWEGSFTYVGSGNNLNLGTGAVTLTGTPQVTVTANTLSVGGVISGTTAGLVKAGAGTLLLAGSNTYGGGTTISAGTLQLGDGTANNGYVQGNILNQSPAAGGLIFANPAGQTYSGTISGTGSVIAAGPGTLTLTSASNAYSGGTSVTGGTLVLAGSVQGSGPVTLAGGTLRLAAAPPTSPIGIKLGVGVGGAGATANVTGPAGVVPMSNWNNFSGGTQSSPASLINSSGSATTATATWNATGNWSTYMGNESDQNAQLLNAYLSNSVGGGSQTLTLSGIPFSSYNVYAYFTNNYANHFGQVAIGGTTYYYQTLGAISTTPYPLIQTSDTTYDSTGASYPLTNYALFSSLSGAAQTIALATQGFGDSGLAAVEIVGLAGQGGPFSAANAVRLTANSTIDVSGVGGGTLGNLSATGSNTLFVTGASTAANTAYSLTLGSVNLGGNPTFDVANNGTGVGTLVLGALGDGGTARTITETDSGALTLAAAATSLVRGTRVNINGGTLNSNNPTALGAFAQVAVAGGATFNLGASQRISSLGGSGKVTLGSNTLTIGNSDNLSSTFAGVLSGNGGLNKSGSGTLTLAGSNTYSGGTSIGAGSLIVDGSLGKTAVAVKGGASLGGTGSIGGSVTVVGGISPSMWGTISLVDGAAATLTLSDAISTDTVLTLGGGGAGSPSALDFEVGATADRILIMAGKLVVNPGGGTVNITPLAGFGPGTFDLMDFPNGQASGLGNLTLGTPTLPGYTLSLQSTPTAEQLVVQSVPEPASLALLGVGAIGLLAYVWRRRRAG